MSREFLLQDWVTLRGNASGASLTQDEECWLDLEGFSDAACWIDVAEVTPPATGAYVSLYLQTSAVCDEAYFLNGAPPIAIGGAAPFYVASVTPIVTRCVRSLGTVNLMRYLRWQLKPSTSGLWDLTFRVRAVASRSTPFNPTDISGCALWLRGDLGVAPFSGTTVSGWADQSGNGRDASQATGAAQPTYSTTAINGLPAIIGDGSSKYMTTGAFDVGASATFFAAVQPAVTTQLAYARILEQDNASSYYLGTTSGGTGYKFIVANNTSPFGAAETGTVATVPSIVSATYGAGTGIIYYNGTNATPSGFGSPSGSFALYLMRKDSLAQSYWNGSLGEVLIYNRILGAAELSRVHRYLGARYGIAVP